MKVSWLLVLVAGGVVRGQRPRVTVREGVLEGVVMDTWLGRKVSAFLGIPYAAPPVGSNRFLPPQPVSSWNVTLDAGTLPLPCTQYFNRQVKGVEDCLYLNVYTPIIKGERRHRSHQGQKIHKMDKRDEFSKTVEESSQFEITERVALLPVIVFIHPGFYMGSSSAFGPRYLLEHDVVLVTLNYRLGILGFLSTGDSVVPGNNGLKDQVAALRWVKENIAAFGGNPEEVTLAGADAGGQSLTYHILSRMSEGLFKRGISIGGSALQPSSQMQASVYKTLTVANSLNCLSDSFTRTVNCLRTVSADMLVLQEGQFQNVYNTPLTVFGPTEERGGAEPFLTQLPYQWFRTGEVRSVPVLFSSTTQEGLIPANYIITNSTGLSYLNSYWNETAPSLLDYNFTVSRRNRNYTNNKVREYYFKNEPISMQNVLQLIEMLSDRLWVDDIETNARILAYVQPSPIYFYRFGYRGEYSLFNILSGSDLNLGVAHTDDLMYILNSTYYPRPENTPSDREMIQILTQLWVNFATYGITSIGETITWEPIEGKSAMNGLINYLMISSPQSLVPSTALTFGNPIFWNELPIDEPGSGRPIFIYQ